MKTIDASPDGIFDIGWSPDSQWVCYVAGDEVRMTSVESGEMRVIGKGSCPGVTAENSVILERDDQIIEVTGSGQRVMASKSDLIADTAKRNSVVSPDGRHVIFVVCDVFHKDSQTKNAYPYRHFWAISGQPFAKSKMTEEQFYGGVATWFPDSERFAHFEFDSTGGARVHIVGLDGVKQGLVAGLYPAPSPDGQALAVRPRGGGSVVIYSTKAGWSDEHIETRVLRIPIEGVERPSACPPIWLDSRLLLVVEGDSLWRIDTKRDKAEVFKKIPAPVNRRKHSMSASPNLETLALEVESEGGFELQVAPLR